jgi:hypothetical protein
MNLKLKRSQRTGGMMGGTLFFALDARLEVTPEEGALIDRYKLGKQFVYDSESRRKHNTAIEASIAANEATNSLRYSGRVLWASALAALSLRITIDSLTAGQHIECKSLDELLAAEEAIREACSNVRVYLNTAEQFDGREEVLAF